MTSCEHVCPVVNMVHLRTCWMGLNEIVVRGIHQVPNLMSFFHCLCRAKESDQVRGALKHFVTIKNFYGEGLAPRPTPSWRFTPCRLSVTAYSIYSQLPSVTGGLHSIRNLRTHHTVVTRGPSNMVPKLSWTLYIWSPSDHCNSYFTWRSSRTFVLQKIGAWHTT
jgi:hypothetical protein